MSYECKILADSISPVEARLTTFMVTFPRIILAEVNTHRMLSRNSASSRAIPVEKQIKKVMEDPFVPIYWGRNQKGMQADRELTGPELREAAHEWLLARDLAVKSTEAMLRLGVHKQITNRLLEPFMWHTAIITGTEWDNFFNLRTHKDAQPEFQIIAKMMQAHYKENIPDEIGFGWHLPLTPDLAELEEHAAVNDLDIEIFCARISGARCGRVSYLTHEGKRDISADLELADRTQTGGHMSHFEHPAQAMPQCNKFYGNFKGFQQYRKLLPNEAVFRSTP